MRHLIIIVGLLLSACGQSPSGEPINTGSTVPAFPEELRCTTAGEPNTGERWITSWMTAPTDALITRPLEQQTSRQFIAPHWDGNRVRLRLQNRFGTAAATIQDVHLGLQGGSDGPTLASNSSCLVTFAGSNTVTIGPGESVVSDPLYFPVRAFEKVAVDFYVPGSLGQISRHMDAREIPYTSAGNRAGQADGSLFLASEFAAANNWLLLEGLDVIAPQNTGVVVTFGNSITDGADQLLNTFSVDNRPQNTNQDQRYPDFLARRLLQAGTALSVANAGISGNELIGTGLVPQFGIGGLDRYRDDILAVPGVTDVIIMIGTNDFGNDGDNTSAQDVIDGYVTLVSDLQANGLNVLMGTIPPAKGFPVEPLPLVGGLMHGSADAASKRAAANEWIKTSGVPDGVVDFEACLQDSADPERLNPSFDSGDHLHPNPSGYQAMANCINLELLSR